MTMTTSVTVTDIEVIVSKIYAHSVDRAPTQNSHIHACTVDCQYKFHDPSIIINYF